MKIKVGQYVRTDKNLIIRMSTSYQVARIEEFHTITKIANNPRELIEVGDLVFINDDMEIVKKIIHEKGWTYFIDRYENHCAIEYITKILTPNSNGGFDLQWSKDNE